MKSGKKMFIIVEAVLAVLLAALTVIMLREQNEKALPKVSVIVQNSDDNQWAAFKYGLRMAAEDHEIELFIVSTEGALSVDDEKELIENEIANGADAIIVQPVPGTETEAMLKKIRKKIPVMLVEYAASEDQKSSSIPIVKSDHYAMGAALAKELLRDYNGKIDGKTLGILSVTENSEASVQREQGFRDVLKDSKAKIRWSLSAPFTEEILYARSEVDFVIAFDDNSMTAAGACAASNNLHGALIYGIGNSTEAVYYLDTGLAKCLVVPDEFSTGYQSLTEAAKEITRTFHSMQSQTVSYTILRKDELFSKENQELIFTMSQ